MARSEWEPSKPFDLRERFLEFACLIVKLVQFLHTRGPIAIELSYQVLKSGTSAGANYEEADDGVVTATRSRKGRSFSENSKRHDFVYKFCAEATSSGPNTIQSSSRRRN